MLFNSSSWSLTDQSVAEEKGAQFSPELADWNRDEVSIVNPRSLAC
jgi:hypothetical protein